MLEKVRNNIKSFGVQAVIVIVVAAFIGTIFLVWGHGGKKEQEGTALAKVNDNVITYREYQQEYIQLVQRYRELYKDQWSEELIEQLQLKQVAFDNIVNYYVLAQKAMEWGIRISEVEAMDYIRSLPIFQDNGIFNSERYRQFLQMKRMSHERFAFDIKKYLLFEKIKERVVGGFKISDEEILDQFAKTTEKIKAEYMIVPVEKFMSQVQINLDELKAYHEEHKDEYLYGDRRSIEYLFVSPRDFEVDAEIADEEVNRYYSQHEHQFVVPKQVKASHILLTVKPDTTPEEDTKIKEKALALLKRIQEEEDFNELAKNFSECPSAKRGGDLGYFGKGKMDPDFERVAFTLNVGEVSQVVRSSFGYHIIKVEDIKPEHVKSIDEVRDQVIQILKAEKGKELALAKIEDILRKIYRGKYMREFAFEDRVTYKTEGPFAQGHPVPGIGRDKSSMNTIFGLEVGQLSRVIETEKGFFVFRLASIEPPRPMTYEEVETRVVQDAKKERAKQIALKEAEMIREKLSSGSEMSSLAKEYHLNVSKTGEVGRGEYISGIGNLDDRQTQNLFSLQSGGVSPVMNTERGYIIFKITEKSGINEEVFVKQKDMLRSRLQEVRVQELFNAWIERIKKDFHIEIYNQEMFS